MRARTFSAPISKLHGNDLSVPPVCILLYLFTAVCQTPVGSVVGTLGVVVTAVAAAEEGPAVDGGVKELMADAKAFLDSFRHVWYATCMVALRTSVSASSPVDL